MGISSQDRFVFHVGSSIWYKNQRGVIRIFQQLAVNPRARDLGFVMVSETLTPYLQSYIDACGLQAKVRVFCGVEPEDLRALYSSAAALLFPSLYEGFGWPIIEAQACGCPVFTSNRPSMTEVGGDGVVYIDPENPEESAGTILETLPHSARMREAGFVNVRRFSVEKMIEGYLNAYEQATKAMSSSVLSRHA
jgi:glycosyltransferase involved in cell wall biosynthesis